MKKRSDKKDAQRYRKLLAMQSVSFARQLSDSHIEENLMGVNFDPQRLDKALDAIKQ